MKNLRIVGLVCVLALLVSVPAMAQYMPSPLVQIIEVQVKPGHNLQWETFAKQVGEAATKTGSPQRWNIYSIVTGGLANTYFVVMPMQGMSDLDGWKSVGQMVMEAYGQDGPAILQTGTSASKTVNMEIYGLLEDFSTHLKETAASPKFYQVIRTEVKPDMMDTYHSVLATASTAVKADPNGPMTIRRASFLGQSFRYLASTGFNSWAEGSKATDLGEIVGKALGENQTSQLFRTLRQCIVKREIMVLAHRPDLSH